MTVRKDYSSKPLPISWTWTTIGSVTQKIEKVKPRDKPDLEFEYLDISSIDNDANIVTSPKKYVGAEAPSRARQQIRAGDVLFSTVRTYLRNIARVPKQFDGQIASTGFSILRPKAGVEGRYLFYYTLTDKFIATLSEIQRGTSYPAVRDSDVREQTIPLAPENEQIRIVGEIEKQFTRLDAAVSSLKRVQANLERYKASVLKAACEGRLVPQDPDDEPAELLLARILAERRLKW
jgi:type I restriction enzyme S subunit